MTSNSNPNFYYSEHNIALTNELTSDIIAETVLELNRRNSQQLFDRVIEGVLSYKLLENNVYCTYAEFTSMRDGVKRKLQNGTSK